MAQILLVQHNAAAGPLVAGALQSAGVQVVVAQSGQQALDAALHDSFAMALVADDLPDMTAAACLDLLQGTGLHCPAVALLVHGDAASQAQPPAPWAACVRLADVSPQQMSALLTQQGIVRQQAVSKWDKLSFDDIEGYDRLKRKYASKLPKVWSDVLAAYTAQDWLALRQKAHAVKGSAGSFGFPELTQAAADLEQAVIDEHMDEIGLLMKQVEQVVQRCMAHDQRGDA